MHPNRGNLEDVMTLDTAWEMTSSTRSAAQFQHSRGCNLEFQIENTAILVSLIFSGSHMEAEIYFRQIKYSRKCLPIISNVN